MAAFRSAPQGQALVAWDETVKSAGLAFVGLPLVCLYAYGLANALLGIIDASAQFLLVPAFFLITASFSPVLGLAFALPAFRLALRHGWAGWASAQATCLALCLLVALVMGHAATLALTLLVALPLTALFHWRLRARFPQAFTPPVRK